MNFFYRCLNYLYVAWNGVDALARKEGIWKFGLFVDCLGAGLRHGCTVSQYADGGLWKLRGAERRKVITNRRSKALYRKYNDGGAVRRLWCKPEFNAFFADFVRREWLDVRECSFEEFREFVVRHGQVMIKPVEGAMGFGVRKYSLADEAGGGPEGQEALFARLQEEKVLVEEVIVQDPRMVFGNASVNTVRTHTVLGADGKAHLVNACLRAGVGDSAVDNYCSGGCVYEVDLETGAVCTPGLSGANERSIVHPGTDIVMLGRLIPRWKEVIEVSERAAERLPDVRIIGWDVAVRPDGVELIEGNHHPDYAALESFGTRGYYKKIMDLLA